MNVPAWHEVHRADGFLEGAVVESGRSWLMRGGREAGYAMTLGSEIRIGCADEGGGVGDGNGGGCKGSLELGPVNCDLYKAAIASKKFEHHTYIILRLDSIFDSSGVSGAIPSTFVALQNLQVMYGSDNELTGSIPEFIGNWSKLSSLRISDLSNGSSSLAFLKDMTSLSTLILRNNNISGTIPSNIGDFKNLSQLFLGNNKLTGMLPALKSPLLHIVLATGLDCIQQNFPCLGDFPSSPKYSDFAINCGGPNLTSSSQIVYEGDNDALGPASYYEASTKRWAVSNVGQFNDKNNAPYTSVSSSPVITNSDSRLFQTARISPGSLRYFGLGLENGNYNVTLHFAETIISDPRTWTSLGRRVFDIYIQAWHVHENYREVELVDARLLEFDEEEVKRVIRVALLCTQTYPQQRPSMPRVVAMLSGDIEVSAVTSRPGYFTDWNFDTTSFMTADTPSAENEHSQFSSSTSRILQVQRT
ncbi:hypothetical protein RHGRI_027240 [Rhododendron griersonianum]|uniref:non-specific serine/threonine protein kinase n=1 Tax=Rhododendron griersonianum TaxID=479676 RepID=A0AAV6IVV4_9ERIC|nr:hypothetical protein RHGRI_027240 [Rhododendron griersonianum]